MAIILNHNININIQEMMTTRGVSIMLGIIGCKKN